MRLLGLFAAAVSERVPLQRSRVSKGRSPNPPRCAHKPSSSTPNLPCYITLAAVAAGETKGKRQKAGKGEKERGFGRNDLYTWWTSGTSIVYVSCGLGLSRQGTDMLTNIHIA